ncbi:BA75_04449T0 [Komagataella pastoris]|uniref:BA75_04449T0 n=1 Tax=Komagataella pastoris TaxID=4922 RepID=A0A1B2JJC9_PICPA|nr:BA75_04449T0 [Komagataella pastoris]
MMIATPPVVTRIVNKNGKSESDNPKPRKLKSCTRCRKHKIKCDFQERKPNACSMCSRKNVQCELEIIIPMKRSNLIKNLNKEVGELKAQINSLVALNIDYKYKLPGGTSCMNYYQLVEMLGWFRKSFYYFMVPLHLFGVSLTDNIYNENYLLFLAIYVLSGDLRAQGAIREAPQDETWRCVYKHIKAQDNIPLVVCLLLSLVDLKWLERIDEIDKTNNSSLVSYFKAFFLNLRFKSSMNLLDTQLEYSCNDDPLFQFHLCYYHLTSKMQDSKSSMVFEYALDDLQSSSLLNLMGNGIEKTSHYVILFTDYLKAALLSNRKETSLSYDHMRLFVYLLVDLMEKLCSVWKLLGIPDTHSEPFHPKPWLLVEYSKLVCSLFVKYCHHPLFISVEKQLGLESSLLFFQNAELLRLVDDSKHTHKLSKYVHYWNSNLSTILGQLYFDFSSFSKWFYASETEFDPFSIIDSQCFALDEVIHNNFKYSTAELDVKLSQLQVSKAELDKIYRGFTMSLAKSPIASPLLQVNETIAGSFGTFMNLTEEHVSYIDPLHLSHLALDPFTKMAQLSRV